MEENLGEFIEVEGDTGSIAIVSCRELTPEGEPTGDRLTVACDGNTIRRAGFEPGAWITFPD